MEYEFAVFRQDLLAAIKAFEEEDFENMNIYSNRIMANSILGDDMKFALPGFFLKDVSIDLGAMKAKLATSAFSTAKALANEYVKKLSGSTSQADFGEGELWKKYHDYISQIRKFVTDRIDEKTYTEPNPTFTRKAFQWLISYLENHQDILLHPKSRILKGISNEMGRIYMTHGVNLEETYAISLITALDRCYDYIKQFSRSESDFQDNVNKEFLPHVNSVVSILKGNPPDEGRVNEELFKLIRMWREYFIEFMEPVPRLATEQVREPVKGVELPEETKKRLTEAITQALKKEAESKK